MEQSETRICKLFTPKQISIFAIIFDILVLSLSFLAGFNFLASRGEVLCVLIAVVVIKGFVEKRIHMNPMSILIIITSVLFTIFYVISYGLTFTNIIVYFIVPVSFCFLGPCFTNLTNDSKQNDRWLLALLAYFFGFFVDEFINLFITYSMIGAFSDSGRLFDFWTGIWYSRTIFSIEILPLFCFCVPFLCYCSNNKVKMWLFRLISALIVCVCLLASALVGNRSFFFIGPFVIVVFLFYFFAKNKKNLKVLFRIFVPIIAIALCFLLLAFTNVLGIGDALSKISVFNRLLHETFGGYGRAYQYKIFFSNFLNYPFGGLATSGLIEDGPGFGPTNMHNVWLQVYCIGGFIPFFVFSFLTIYILYIICKIQITGTASNGTRLVLFTSFSTIVGVFCLYLFEPLLVTNNYLASIPYLSIGVLADEYYRQVWSKRQTVQYTHIQNGLKYVFIANFVSLHTEEFANELFAQSHGNFFFISTDVINADHKMYDEKLSKKHPYEISIFNSKQKANEIIENSDVILYANGCEKYISRYRNIKNHKLFVCVTERIYKKTDYQMYNPKFVLSRLIHFKRSFSSDYCLTMSAYASSDFSLIHQYQNKCYKWGYLVKPSSVNSFDKLNKTKNSIIFANRLIAWKHPELVIRLAKSLMDDGLQFSISIVGRGPMEEPLKKQVINSGLSNYVHFLGIVPNKELRIMMEQNEILLSCSSRMEGWGVSVLEGMMSGCAVVSSVSTGSAPRLIDNGVDGFLYADEGDFIRKVKDLLINKKLLHSIEEKAFEKSNILFSPENATKRFIVWSEDVALTGGSSTFIDGPCSPDSPQNNSVVFLNK